MQKAIKTIAERLAAAKSGVAFTGAGISTESGIPDFRSPGGIWSKFKMVYFDDFLARHEARVDYWRMHKAGFEAFAAAGPNKGHEVLAKWEREGRLAGIITQNIDGLHQAAGSRRVQQLHGTARVVSCLSCGREWPSPAIYQQYENDDNVPVCEHCGGWLKPATISFGQALPEEVFECSCAWADESDVFLAIGSSLVVQPAAMIPVRAARRGALLVIINRDPTPCDDMADIVLRKPIGETLASIDVALDAYRSAGGS